MTRADLLAARAVRRALLARRRARVRARIAARRAGCDLYAEWIDLGEAGA